MLSLDIFSLYYIH